MVLCALLIPKFRWPTANHFRNPSQPLAELWDFVAHALPRPSTPPAAPHGTPNNTHPYQKARGPQSPLFFPTKASGPVPTDESMRASPTDMPTGQKWEKSTFGQKNTTLMWKFGQKSSYRFISAPQVREVRQGGIGLKYFADLRQSHNNPRSRIWQVNCLAGSYCWRKARLAEGQVVLPKFLLLLVSNQRHLSNSCPSWQLSLYIYPNPNFFSREQGVLYRHPQLPKMHY